MSDGIFDKIERQFRPFNWNWVQKRPFLLSMLTYDLVLFAASLYCVIYVETPEGACRAPLPLATFLITADAFSLGTFATIVYLFKKGIFSKAQRGTMKSLIEKDIRDLLCKKIGEKHAASIADFCQRSLREVDDFDPAIGAIERVFLWNHRLIFVTLILSSAFLVVFTFDQHLLFLRISVSALGTVILYMLIQMAFGLYSAYIRHRILKRLENPEGRFLAYQARIGKLDTSMSDFLIQVRSL